VPSVLLGPPEKRAAEGRSSVWTCDLLPDDMCGAIDAMITQGMAAMKRSLDALGTQ
jgi:hypothetical protein